MWILTPEWHEGTRTKQNTCKISLEYHVEQEIKYAKNDGIISKEHRLQLEYSPTE